jgi:hypothetical protein
LIQPDRSSRLFYLCVSLSALLKERIFAAREDFEKQIFVRRRRFFPLAICRRVFVCFSVNHAALARTVALAWAAASNAVMVKRPLSVT